MRRAELLGVLSMAADAGMGHPTDLGLRTAALAGKLGELCGLDAVARDEAFQLALLRFSGCTADTHLAADAFGDEVSARGWLALADFGKPTDVMAAVVKNLGAGAPFVARVRMVAHAFARMSSLFDAARAHCEVAQRLAQRLDLPPRIVELLGQVFERWDGRGIPKHLAREQIAPSVLCANLCHDAILFHHAGGREAALDIVAKRSNGAFPAAMTTAFADRCDELWPIIEAPSAWQAMLDAEPGDRRVFDDAAIDSAFGVLADFADLKSRFTPGHSQAVAALAERAARILGLDDAGVRVLRRAALAHDLGMAGVTASIWDKAGALSDEEWEKVRLHSYVTGRCLGRVAGLKAVAELAQSHHEQLDGNGYFRQVGKDALSPAARILAAADAYAAMVAARAYRPARTPAETAVELRRDVDRGRLCAQAVAAVLEAAGHADASARRERPAGLSDRELEVLRLLCRGLTNKEMATSLGIATKTVGHHVQHIYGKIGVSTRAAATLYAVEHGLVRP